MKFENYIQEFLKWPVTIDQEAKVISAMIDGSINKNGAITVLQYLIKNNMKKFDGALEKVLYEIS